MACRIASFLEGLRVVGYHEPDQVALIARVTGGDPSRVASMASGTAAPFDASYRLSKERDMPASSLRPPIAPGELAPDFVLPAVNQNGNVTLADYRGRAPVLLAMMRGLYCAFCRRHIAQLSTTRQKLRAIGVETLAIVAMQPERLRLYYHYRPVAVPLAADPELTTHRAYGVPSPALTPDILQAVESRHIELARELKIPATSLAGIKDVLCQKDGFVPVEAELKDRRDWSDRYGGQLIGQFLVDREGIVRWVNIEGAKDGLAGLEKFPSDEEFMAAAQQFVN